MARARVLVLFAQVLSASGACAGGACGATRKAEQNDVQGLMQMQRPLRAQEDVGKSVHKHSEKKSREAKEIPAGYQCALKPMDGMTVPALRSERREPPHVACDLPTQECHMEDGEGCELRHMELMAVHHVYPGGLTQCLGGDPFYFAVKRGHPQKLLFVLDANDYRTWYCPTAPSLPPWSGIMNYSTCQNPYHDYTIIRVPYCSCDYFIGDSTSLGRRGYRNTDAALQWALLQFPGLSKLGILGVSSGALGVQLWADSLIQHLASAGTDVVVYADSFAGFMYPMPPSELLNYQYINFAASWWNTCNLPILSSAEQGKCLDQTGGFTFQWKFSKTISEHPTVLFMSLSSKADRELNFFSSSVSYVLPEPTEEEVYREMTQLFQDFSQHPNFRAYLMNGEEPWLLTDPRFFQATPLGMDAANGAPSVLHWVCDAQAWDSRPPEYLMLPHACIGKEAPSSWIVLKHVGGPVVEEIFYDEASAIARFDELYGGNYAAAVYTSLGVQIRWYSNPDPVESQVRGDFLAWIAANNVLEAGLTWCAKTFL